MSMINQKQVLFLQQKLSPQQIQMIKLLELPTMQLEQRIKQEIEENIVLEEDDHTPEDEQPQQISVEEYLREDETPSYKSRINNYSKDDKPRQAPLAGGRSLQEYLVEQLGYRNLSEQDMRLAVYLVGSIEEDAICAGVWSYRRRHRLHAGRRCFGRALGTIAVDYPRTRTDRCRCPQPAGVFIVAIGSGES